MASSPISFRPDVEGLRAIAVIMVLMYHLEVPHVMGGFAGVDVFFVISGYLITNLLLKEAESSGGISLLRFYARRAKRLLPAAALTILATAVAVRWLFPSTRWLEIGGDLVGASLYYVNWRLALRSVDYLAEDSLASPVQHFWTLAVEEQYYLLWPLLLLIGLKLATKRLSPRKTAWIVLALVAIPSFIWSVYSTASSPEWAYFDSAARLWELAIGSAIALSAPRLSAMPQAVSAALGWCGMAAILGSLFFQSGENSPWPGYAATLPVLGTAAVIAAGLSAGSSGPASILGTRLFCWIGGLSYTMYLWHWPLIVFVQHVTGQISVITGVSIAAVTIGLAWLTQQLVENPIRYSGPMTKMPQYALSVGLCFSLVGALAGLGLTAASINSIRAFSTGEAHQTAARGAAVLRSSPRDDPKGAPVDRVDWIIPPPELATRDVSNAYDKGCQVNKATFTPVVCEYGPPESSVIIAMVGDSKLTQWASAMEALANKHAWRVLLYAKGACSFNSITLTYRGKPYHECDRWNRLVLEQLQANPPDYLLTSSGRRDPHNEVQSGWDESMVNGYIEWWRKLEVLGVRIIAIADNPMSKPRDEASVYECVVRHPNELTRCSFKRGEGRGSGALREAARRTNSHFIDLNDAICPVDPCAPVIGNVLIYRQGSHLTKTYVDSLMPRLESELLAVGLPSGRDDG